MFEGTSFKKLRYSYPVLLLFVALHQLLHSMIVFLTFRTSFNFILKKIYVITCPLLMDNTKTGQNPPNLMEVFRQCSPTEKNIEHRTEHDIDRGYGFCLHY